MKDDAKADLARFVDRWTVEYVRVYPHPIERIWRATSDPKEDLCLVLDGDVRFSGRRFVRVRSREQSNSSACSKRSIRRASFASKGLRLRRIPKATFSSRSYR